MKIGVLLGGSSQEREVSLESGKAISAACKALGHDVLEIDPKNGIVSLFNDRSLIVPYDQRTIGKFFLINTDFYFILVKLAGVDRSTKEPVTTTTITITKITIIIFCRTIQRYFLIIIIILYSLIHIIFKLIY